MKSGLELTLLGAPQIRWRGTAMVPQARHQALLCYLALETSASRETLTELLWGAGKSANLRTALYTLRHLSGAEMWLEDAERVTLRASSDIATLRGAVSKGDFAETEALLAHTSPTLLEGLKAPTPAFEEWLEEQRAQTSELLRQALWGVAQTCRQEGRLDTARDFALKLVTLGPEDEAAHRLLMRLEHERGDAEGVRGAFERCLSALTDLGGEPSPETFRLRAELLGAEGTLTQGVRYTLGDAVLGRAPDLIGRGDLLKTLTERLHERPALLHGFGGVGKTALAAELASSFLGTGDVLWLHVGWSRQDELLSAARQLLGLSGSDALALKDALSPLALLVLDDIWNPQAVSGLQDWLPPGLAVLATSRQRLSGFARIALTSLARQDAVALLRLSAQTPIADPEADTLCTVLADHPYALRLAGAQLRGGTTPAQLLARLANAPHTLEAPQNWRDEERESIRALLSTSLDTLSDAAYHAFLAMGALGSRSVTPELLALCTRRDLDETEAALSELQSQALAERRARPGSDIVRYLLHDLSYSFARHNTTLRARSVMNACRIFLQENTRVFELLGEELPNIVGALETAHDTAQRELFVEMMALLTVGDAYFAARGHTPRTLKLLEKALQWAKELGQLERAHYLAGRLGDTYRVLYQQHDKALAAYQEGARLAQLMRNPSREATLTSLCGIERHYLGQASEQDFDRAYRLAEESEDRLVLGLVLQHRSYVAWAQQDWLALEQFSRKAVAIVKGSAEQAHDELERDKILFHALTNFSEAMGKLGHFAEAVDIRLQAFAIAVARDNQLWQADALHDLGEIHEDKGLFQEATAYLDRALLLYEENHASAEAQEVRERLWKLKVTVDFTSS